MNRNTMSWKQTLTMSALDSASYRDKLSLVMEDARTLHLSETEAAQKYGEVVACLITLQRRVRSWVEERQKVCAAGRCRARRASPARSLWLS
jgi:hypothetical protein